MLEILSRLQFAFTVAFHFLFVPFTIGLIIFVLIFEHKYYKTDDIKYKRLSDFFGNLFIINYAFGIVTGIVMTVQFGTNWAEYSRAMGDVFGSPLVIEALLAFFLEATFSGIWAFRKNRISKTFRLVTVWMIFIGVLLSALWIISANGFMQNPVGATWIAEEGRVVFSSFSELFFNPYSWYMFLHTNLASILLTGFIVLAISMYHIQRKYHEDTFKISAKIAAWVILISAISMPIVGYTYMNFIAAVQPDKINMITNGISAAPEVSAVLPIIVKTAFHSMTVLGTIFILFGLYVVVFYNKVHESVNLKKIAFFMIPLPYIAIITGWMVTEMGRQPWIIYNMMKVSEGISTVPVSQVLFSIILLVVFYVLLFFMDYYLSIKAIKKGFEGEN
ncbi:MAG: cytochrome ubiquinol oxidase subunit I [Firmicutes bacterium]|nr:cytochrome ubiquinol oxidase subunit I [Bacillota bacterium]